MTMEFDLYGGASVEELEDGSMVVRYPDSETFYVYHPDGTETIHYGSGTIIKYGIKDDSHKSRAILEITSAAEGIEGITFIPDFCGGWMEKDPKGEKRMMIDSVGMLYVIDSW